MERTTEHLDTVVIRFAGDSGDGMQLAGSQFTQTSAVLGNDISTFPDFPAEIRAPEGTLFGVSSFQLHFGSLDVSTPGDKCDVLVAMNAAALKTNLSLLKPNGILITNISGFDDKNLRLAHYEENPLAEDSNLGTFQHFSMDITKLTLSALQDIGLSTKQAQQMKNFFALGLLYWLFNRPLTATEKWIEKRFADNETLRNGNLRALRAGWNYGETTEIFTVRYDVRPAALPAGVYRNITGNTAISLGLVAASQQARLPLFLGSYPITPASDILHTLSGYKHFGVRTFQAEDEIAAITSAIGASYGGALAVTTTSGPGLALKTEALGLAIATELPLVVVDVQRAGPSTGMPTKTEQTDLQFALYGRNGEAPAVVIAPSTPADCFTMAFEAARISVEHMTPVILLSEAFLANGSEPWKIPHATDLPSINAHFTTEAEGFQPYSRHPDTLARPWAVPGTPGLEHRIGGLEKQDGSGNVSYDPANHEKMVHLRAEKIRRIANTLPPAKPEGDQEGELLVIGWGGTYGAIKTATEILRAEGIAVGHLHLRYINPLQHNVKEVLSNYNTVAVVELNSGHLKRYLQAEFLHPMVGVNKVQGQPFKSNELLEQLRAIVNK